MTRTKILGALLASTALITLALTSDAFGGGKSDAQVKAKAAAGKIDDKGQQMVTITLAIDKGWHLYANPTNHNNDFLNSNKTLVTFAVNGKAVKGTVFYPAGTTKTDGKDKYDVYTDTVKVDALVQRTPGDKSPLEITVAVNACDKSVCLERGKIKLTVP